MSWQDYIEVLSNNTGGDFYAGSICGVDGNVWATSKDFNTTQSEIVNMVKVLRSEDTAEEKQFQQYGVFVASEKYRYVRKIDDTDGLSTLNFALAKEDIKYIGSVGMTKDAIILCVCRDSGQGKKALNAVVSLVKYLRGLNM